MVVAERVALAVVPLSHQPVVQVARLLVVNVQLVDMDRVIVVGTNFGLEQKDLKSTSCLSAQVIPITLPYGTSRCFWPVYNCRGRPILDLSAVISSQWDIQPTVRAKAKITVNIFVGIPMALNVMPE